MEETKANRLRNGKNTHLRITSRRQMIRCDKSFKTVFAKWRKPGRCPKRTILIYHFLSPSCSPTPFTTFTTMTTTMTSQVNQHFKCKIKIKATNYLSILSPCRPDPPRKFRSCLRRVWRGPGLDGASPNLGGLRHLRGQQSILATLSAAWKEVEVLWMPFGGTRRWRFR